MTTHRSLIPCTLIAGLAFALAAPAAHAVTLSTPLLGPTNSGAFVCYVSNVGTKPTKVTVTLYDRDGTAIAPTENDCVTAFGGVLPPGKSCSASDALPGGGTGGGLRARCSVDSSSSKVRAVLANDVAGLTSQAATK
jgi:hypothetical protein